MCWRRSAESVEFTLNALVSQSAPATLTNTAVVAGGNEANLLNDIATDVASVTVKCRSQCGRQRVAESGDCRKQHYLYASRHEQRAQRRRQRNLRGYDSGEYDYGFDCRASRLELSELWSRRHWQRSLH